MGVLDFLSKEAGQARRRALDERIAGVLDRVGYYAGPELSEFGRGLLQVGGMLNPIAALEDSSRAGERMFAPDRTPMQRAGDTAEMLSGVAATVAPVVAGRMSGGVVDDAANVMESLLGWSPTKQALIDRANQRGPMPDRLGVFAGSNALTADKAALKTAQNMADAGVGRDDIWRETGWFQGVDGKWRFEIDDSKAYSAIKETADEMSEGIIPQDADLTLGEVFGHNALLEAYPGVGDINTRLVSGKKLDAIVPGSYGGVTKGGDLVFRDDIIDTGRPLHEIQHIIQRLEGFASGGDPRVLGKEDYMRLAGEVEARNAGNRALFDPELRKSVPPWETQDVVDEEQILQFLRNNEMGVDAPPSLPTPTNDAEAMAKRVLEMRAAGRAGDVTEEMMAATDPQYMFANTPLPMDEASRMARAREMGLLDDAYHATGAEFQQFIPSEFRGASFFGNTPEGASKGASASANEGVGSGSNIMMPVRVNTSGVEGLGRYARRDMNEFRASLPDRVYTEAEVDALMASDAAPLRGNWSDFFDDLTDYDALRVFREQNPDAPIPDGMIAFRPKQPLSYGPHLNSTQALDLSGRQFAHYSEGMSERPTSEYVKSQGNTGFTMMDESGLALAMTDPTKIRSRFARFDPEFRHLRNLSAAGLLGLPLLPQDETQQSSGGLL